MHYASISCWGQLEKEGSGVRNKKGSESRMSAGVWKYAIKVKTRRGK